MNIPVELRHLYPGCIISSPISTHYVYLITEVQEDGFSLAWLRQKFYDDHPSVSYYDVHKTLQDVYMKNCTSDYTTGVWLFSDALKSISKYSIFNGKFLSPMSEYIL